MNDYEVTLSLDRTYTVSAPTEEEAIEIAYDYFMEAEPEIYVEKIKNEK